MNWSIVKRSLGELVPFAQNPRLSTKAGVEKLNQSLEQFGTVRTFVINTDGTIIGGNQMYQALLKKYGKDYHVNCHIPDQALSEKELKALNIKLNKSAGEWDFKALKAYNEANDLLQDFEAWELGIHNAPIVVPEVRMELEEVSSHSSFSEPTYSVPPAINYHTTPSHKQTPVFQTTPTQTFPQTASVSFTPSPDALVPFTIMLPFHIRETVYGAINKAKALNQGITTEKALEIIAQTYQEYAQ